MASPELTGGAGFTFEDAVAACYLAALVGGTTAPSLGSRMVQRVALQQAPAGEPLDDVIVDAVLLADGSRMRLSLQVKRSLTISDAASNSDFREVIERSWQTLQKTDFREHVDRVGAATGTISDESHRNFTTVCEWARASESASSFFQRFADGGGASQAHKDIVDAVRNCALGNEGQLPEEATHRLLAHMVLIKFDLMHQGSTTEAATLCSLQRALVSAQHDRADDLWRQLRQLCREGSGRREEFSRASVLRQLNGGLKFVGSPVLASDLRVLSELSSHWLAQHPGDIGGTHIDRSALREKLITEMGRHRLTLIKGLPGVGKTVLLRDLLGCHASNGTTFLLTANRLSGNSWAEHARAIGLSAIAIEPLLVEVMATGQAVLFIDGLDRITPEQRGVITDLMAQILTSPALSGWRIVATARDAGIEPLRSWVPTALMTNGGVGYVDVDNLSPEDAEALANSLPALRPLLLDGDERVQALARRPFFASVLARGFSSAAYPEGFVPRSEIDLIRAWWSRGGYDAQASQILARQRALIELAQRSAPDLGRNLRIRDLSAATQSALPALLEDGLVQQVRPGLTAQFSHDIFFEWAYLLLLEDEGEDWMAALTGAGEPPALARVVELLSQATYDEPDAWERHLRTLEAATLLRPQWLRAWLEAPVFSPSFDAHAARLTPILTERDHKLLRKWLVWMRAEKTTPNPVVLAGQIGRADMTPAARIKLADSTGWPSDFLAWRRLLNWALDYIADIPDECLPDVVALFDTWQLPLMDVPNPLSRRILDQCVAWLHAIEDEHQAPRWRQAEDADGDAARPRAPAGVETELRGLVLRAARSYPDVVDAYLTRVVGLERFSGEAFREVMAWATLLSQTHPEQLAAIARSTFLEELPDERRARERRESEERVKQIHEIRAKPEAERTRGEQRFLEHLPFSMRSSGSFSYHDRTRLALTADFQGYFPASPLREPFHALLTHAPTVGRALVRDLANHATTAWRQFHRHERPVRVPIPLVLALPWGRQEFWGAPIHYVWSRGHGGPKVLECALMALEDWAFRQLKAGRPAGEVLEELLQGHTSIAVLGIAVTVALLAREVSRVTLPLVSSQRLWRIDVERSVQDSQLREAALIGFEPHEAAHRQAVIESGNLPVRRAEIRSLVPLFVLGADEELRSACRAALEQFPSQLELDYEDLAQDEVYLTELRRKAELWAEFGRQENYATAPVPNQDGMVAIELRSPSHEAPDMVEAREHFEEIAQEAQLWHWVQKCFEAGALIPDLSLDDAAERAKSMALAVAAGTNRSLMPNNEIAHGGISGTAAVIICLAGTHEHEEWAVSTLWSYRDEVEAPQDEVFSKSVISWHPKIFVARALAARIRDDRCDGSEREALYRLVLHPLQVVALEAVSGIAACWNRDPQFTWCGFNLALKLARYRRVPSTPRPEASEWARMEEERKSRALAEALAELTGPAFPPLAQPMPSWTQTHSEGEAWQPMDEDGWRSTDDIWLSEFAGAVLRRVPIDGVLRGPARDQLIDSLEGFVTWTLDTVNPSWRTEGRRGRGRDGTSLFEWQRQLARLLADVIERTPSAELRRRLLAPIMDQPDEVAMRMLAPFSSALAASAVIDAPRIDPQVLSVLDAVVDRVLEHGDFRRSRYNDGRLGGFDLPDLIKTLLFVAITGANGATRFANGQWSDLPQILPLLDKLVRHAAWNPYVATQFVTLCERAGADYPADAFADQVLAQLAADGLPTGWRETAVPAAIAGLVQGHADRHHPLPLALARKLLKVLDALVDLGDRRSAALQQSEAFRGVRLAMPE